MLSPGSFSAKLAAAMQTREMGARTLARMIDPANVEQARKSVRRWLRGTTASQANRDLITDALSLERGALDPDDEEDVMAPLMRDVFHAAFSDPELRDRFKRALDEAAA